MKRWVPPRRAETEPGVWPGLWMRVTSAPPKVIVAPSSAGVVAGTGIIAASAGWWRVGAPVSPTTGARACRVVGVAVGREDSGELALADHRQEAIGVVRGVDQERLARREVGEQVGVVVHRTDGELAELHLGTTGQNHLPRDRGPAGLHVAVVAKLAVGITRHGGKCRKDRPPASPGSCRTPWIDSPLVAPERQSGVLHVSGAREHNLKNIDSSPARQTHGIYRPVRIGKVVAWRSTPSMRRASGGTSSRCPPMRGSSSGRWASPTWTP